MNVLYLGHGRIGCMCLRKLVDAGINVKGVLSRVTDRNNGAVDTESSVFNLSQTLRLRFFDVSNPNDPEFIKLLGKMQLDYIISIQYDRILGGDLLKVPGIGSINLHFSPLPLFRGCYPTKWAILKGLISGVTLHLIDEGIDTGKIILQKKCEIKPDDTDLTLYHSLESIGEELFQEFLDRVKTDSLPKPKEQESSSASYYRKEEPLGRFINWAQNSEQVSRMLRAYTFPPFPSARTYIRGREVQLRFPFKIESNTSEEHLMRKAGSFYINFNTNELIAKCGSGEYFRFKEVFLDGLEVTPKVFSRQIDLKAGRFDNREGVRR